MDKGSKSFKTTGVITDEVILAISWDIATEPKLYRELASNPYSKKSKQKEIERFPNVNTTDIIKAVVLAEPEGKFDRKFSLLEKTQQTEELGKQTRTSWEMDKRLVEYCNKHKKEFNWLPKKYLYESLSKIAFETVDIRKIEKIYPQDQRRDYRISIVVFIEDAQKPIPNQNIKYSFYSFGAFDIKQVLGEQKLKVAFATFSLIVPFYLAHGIYQKQNVSKHVQNTIFAAQIETRVLPVHLKIPKINVDATIETVGITEKGAMDVPDNTFDVGWYKMGPSPGEIGSAVISGHFDGRKGEIGVFNNLDKLKPGDKIYITNDRGKTTTFIIRQSRNYDPGYADEVFLPNDNGKHLNLVTCDGFWDGAKKSYSKRLVVFADLIK